MACEQVACRVVSNSQLVHPRRELLEENVSDPAGRKQLRRAFENPGVSAFHVNLQDLDCLVGIRKSGIECGHRHRYGTSASMLHDSALTRLAVGSEPEQRFSGTISHRLTDNGYLSGQCITLNIFLQRSEIGRHDLECDYPVIATRGYPDARVVPEVCSDVDEQTSIRAQAMRFDERRLAHQSPLQR